MVLVGMLSKPSLTIKTIYALFRYNQHLRFSSRIDNLLKDPGCSIQAASGLSGELLIPMSQRRDMGHPNGTQMVELAEWLCVSSASQSTQYTE